MSRFHARPYQCLILAVAASTAFAAYLPAQRSAELQQQQYEGTLGNSRIGMTIICEGNKIEGGHYFYQKFLQDISITGSMQGSRITLIESGGGAFHLHFVGNGSEKGRPLDFENSIGMEGTWKSADETRSKLVSLGGTLVRPGANDQRRYGDVTSENDAAFERRTQTLFRSVLRGDKSSAVRFISYPLSVNFPNGKTKKFPDSAAVLSAWNDIFTPAMIARLQQDLPHDMFVRNGMAMLGNGEAWFDARGLATVNVPPPPVSAP
jgi:hypothetical protein